MVPIVGWSIGSTATTSCKTGLRFWPIKRIRDLTSCFYQTWIAWEFLHSSCSEIWNWLRHLVSCWYHSGVITGIIQCEVCDRYLLCISSSDGVPGWATFGGYSLAMIWKHWPRIDVHVVILGWLFPCYLSWSMAGVCLTFCLVVYWSVLVGGQATDGCGKVIRF